MTKRKETRHYEVAQAAELGLLAEKLGATKSKRLVTPRLAGVWYELTWSEARKPVHRYPAHWTLTAHPDYDPSLCAVGATLVDVFRRATRKRIPVETLELRLWREEKEEIQWHL